MSRIKKRWLFLTLAILASVAIHLPFYSWRYLFWNYQKDQYCPHNSTTGKEFNGYLSYPEKEPLRMQCSSCAIVTGSGHLLGSEKGSEIDSMDCVFRTNDAPTVGFEEDVGSKTTARTVDRTSLHIIQNPIKRMFRGFGLDELQRCPTPVIISVFWPEGIQEEFEITHQMFPQLKLYAATPEKYNEILEVFRKRVSAIEGSWWSNGFKTIQIAHEVCDSIHVYGITDEDYCKRVSNNNPDYHDVPYHYYANLGIFGSTNCGFIKHHDQRDKKAHPFTKEKILFKTLVKEWGNLHFYAPEWPA